MMRRGKLRARHLMVRVATREVGVLSRVRGRDRLALLRLHRLMEFNEAWDKYIAGQVTASFVKHRANKMLAVGLPKCLK